MKKSHTRHFSGLFLILLLAASFILFTACPEPASNLTSISSFVFPAADNNALAADITAVIDGAAITAAVPHGTSVASLKAVVELPPGASISPDPSAAQNYTSPVAFTVTAADGKTTEDYTVTVTVAPANAGTEAAVTSFVFTAAANASLSTDAAGTISGTSITVSVPYGTSVTALVPTIAVSAGATVNPASGAARNFTSPVTYTVTAEDAVTTAAYTVTVTKLDAVIVGGNVFGALALSNAVTTEAGARGIYGNFEGTAIGALMNGPNYGVAVGSYIYFSDSNGHRIRKFDPATNTVTTLSGTGTAGYADGSGTSAQFRTPRGLAYDGTDLYVADTDNSVIRRISLSDGSTELVAGIANSAGFADGTGSTAQFNYPWDLCYHDGFLYVSDTSNHRIRKIDPDTGVVTTLAGDGTNVHSDGTGTAAQFSAPRGITCDGTDLWVATNQTVRRITLPGAVVTTPFGAAGASGFNDSIGTAARFNNPYSLIHHDGFLYVAEAGNQLIRKLNLSDDQVSTLAGTTGTPGVTDGTYTAAKFHWPYILGVIGDYLYTADEGASTLRRTHLSTRAVTTLAGSAYQHNFQDGTGTGPLFHSLAGVTTDGEYLYFTEENGSNIVRRINMTTLETSHVTGIYSGSGSTDNYENSLFYYPRGIVYLDGFLYVCDRWNHTIRKIQLSDTEVSTFAGTQGTQGNADGIGLAATFRYPTGITTDGTNLYVTDMSNHTIRKIVIATREVTTLAGTAQSTGTADGTGADARFNLPDGITTDGTNLYVADSQNHTVRKIVIATGQVTTLAGFAGTSGAVNDIGQFARFNYPVGIACDGTNLYVTEQQNHLVRKIVISTASVSSVAGAATQSGWADGTGTTARFSSPKGIVCAGGALWVMDASNYVIRCIE